MAGSSDREGAQDFESRSIVADQKTKSAGTRYKARRSLEGASQCRKASESGQTHAGDISSLEIRTPLPGIAFMSLIAARKRVKTENRDSPLVLRKEVTNYSSLGMSTMTPNGLKNMDLPGNL
jgi:hypothetical protein